MEAGYLYDTAFYASLRESRRLEFNSQETHQPVNDVVGVCTTHGSPVDSEPGSIVAIFLPTAKLPQCFALGKYLCARFA